MLLPALAVASRLPDALSATETGYQPVPNGEPNISVSVPPAPTENTDTVLLPRLAVASTFPDALNAIEFGYEPVPTGEPDTSVSAPSDPTKNTDTVLSFWLAVASRFPDAPNATEIGYEPLPNGEPDTGANAGGAARAAVAVLRHAAPTTTAISPCHAIRARHRFACADIAKLIHRTAPTGRGPAPAI